MEQWENGDDDVTGSLQPTIRPDSNLWHGINQTSAIFSFPSAVARNDTGRELRGFADARTLLCLCHAGDSRGKNYFQLFSATMAQVQSLCAIARSKN